MSGLESFLVFAFAALQPTSCGLEGLRRSSSRIRFPVGTITKAELVRSGPASADSSRSSVVPRHGYLKPSPDSDIKMELWLPDNWNGKLEGERQWRLDRIDQSTALSAGVKRGYASAMSDLGHEGSRATFAMGHPEKLVDFGYRAAHEMTLAAKAITAAYYKRAPAHSYWTGCSAGGRSALMEAQRYPADYDGIVAGAPGWNWTGRALQSVRIAQAAHKDEQSYISSG